MSPVFSPTRTYIGFTLVELLVVIAILAIIFTVSLNALNPARQFSQANDTKRASDVNAILNAIGQYAADHNGALPAVVLSTPTVIGKGPGQLDICTYLIPKYLPFLPVDPSTNNGKRVKNCNDPYDTNYQVSKDTTTKRITVSAPATEGPKPTISATR